MQQNLPMFYFIISFKEISKKGTCFKPCDMSNMTSDDNNVILH